MVGPRLAIVREPHEVFGGVAKGRDAMDSDIEVLKRMYDRFNARDIDGVLTALADDVAWANG